MTIWSCIYLLGALLAPMFAVSANLMAKRPTTMYGAMHWLMRLTFSAVGVVSTARIVQSGLSLHVWPEQAVALAAVALAAFIDSSRMARRHRRAGANP